MNMPWETSRSSAKRKDRGRGGACLACPAGEQWGKARKHAQGHGKKRTGLGAVIGTRLTAAEPEGIGQPPGMICTPTSNRGKHRRKDRVPKSAPAPFPFLTKLPGSVLGRQSWPGTWRVGSPEHEQMPRTKWAGRSEGAARQPSKPRKLLGEKAGMLREGSLRWPQLLTSSSPL